MWVDKGGDEVVCDMGKVGRKEGREAAGTEARTPLQPILILPPLTSPLFPSSHLHPQPPPSLSSLPHLPSPHHPSPPPVSDDSTSPSPPPPQGLVAAHMPSPTPPHLSLTLPPPSHPLLPSPSPAPRPGGSTPHPSPPSSHHSLCLSSMLRSSQPCKAHTNTGKTQGQGVRAPR